MEYFIILGEKGGGSVLDFNDAPRGMISHHSSSYPSPGPINAPYTSSYNYWEIYTSVYNDGYQFAYDVVTETNFYVRGRANGYWKPWHKIIFDSDIEV